MKLNITEKIDESGMPCLLLDGEMTIYSAGHLHKELRSRLDDSPGLVIDLSGVLRIDTAGFQLLMSARREWGEKGIDMRLIHPADDVKRIFSLYGTSL